MVQLHAAGHDPDADIVLAAYAAFGRGDIDAAVADLHPDVEWIEPDEFPDDGRHVGRDTVRQYLQRSRDSWRELRSTPTLHRRGERIVVQHHVEGALQDGTHQEVTVADVFTLRDGRVVHLQAHTNVADVPN
jgi:ketosteroid isomerase-like protein